MKQFLLTIIVSFCLVACKKKKSDEINKPAIPIEKITALTAYPGRDRIKLSWNLPSDAQLTKCRVFWNNKSDSLEVSALAATDTMSVILNDLEEGDYIFSVVIFNNKGNASEPVSINSHAYGSQYEISLKNRSLKDVAFNEGTSVAVINWNNSASAMIGSELKYTNNASVSHTISVSPFSSSTSLDSFKPGSIFVYRTLYLPAIGAIDTFYTAYDTISVGEELPRDDDYPPMITLKADGPEDTYELLDRVLGGTAEETPDCAHPSFGRHITEEFDSQLNENVFAFFAHVTPDNDRCVNFDRQRVEIKTYGPSPDKLKAFDGDEMIFKWKFRLDAGFQPSSSFTHIHQIKAGDGPNDGSPLITITPRYGNPDKLEIIHTGNSSATTQGKVKIVELAPFKGTWIEATEKIKFGSHGTYSLILKKVTDGTVLLTYTNNDIDLWRTGSTFIRPKWGIYRSLNDAGRLRDEKVLFADFSIGKK